MAWAIAIAFLALFLLWIVTGFIGELLAYRLGKYRQDRHEDDWRGR